MKRLFTIIAFIVFSLVDCYAVASNEVIENTYIETNEKEIEDIYDKTKQPKDKKESYSDNDLYVMAHVIMGEADGCEWDMMEGVGSVVLNRVKSDLYPDSIEEVVFQDGQYACTWDGNYDKTPSEQAVEVAKYLLENGSQFPDDVIFQAQFKQGSGVYKTIGNMYFCVK